MLPSVEFLSDLDEKERSKLLAEMTKTVERKKKSSFAWAELLGKSGFEPDDSVVALTGLLGE